MLRHRMLNLVESPLQASLPGPGGLHMMLYSDLMSQLGTLIFFICVDLVQMQEQM